MHPLWFHLINNIYTLRRMGQILHRHIINPNLSQLQRSIPDVLAVLAGVFLCWAEDDESRGDVMQVHEAPASWAGHPLAASTSPRTSHLLGAGWGFGACRPGCRGEDGILRLLLDFPTEFQVQGTARHIIQFRCVSS